MLFSKQFVRTQTTTQLLVLVSRNYITRVNLIPLWQLVLLTLLQKPNPLNRITKR
jgi:hypothetical protein